MTNPAVPMARLKASATLVGGFSPKPISRSTRMKIEIETHGSEGTDQFVHASALP
jgi:hypothetical protein